MTHALIWSALALANLGLLILAYAIGRGDRGVAFSKGVATGLHKRSPRFQLVCPHCFRRMWAPPTVFNDPREEHERDVH